MLSIAVTALVALGAVPAAAGDGTAYEGTLHQKKDRPLTLRLRHRRVQELDVKAAFDCENDDDSGVYTLHYRGLNIRFREGRRFTYDRWYGEPPNNDLTLKGRIVGSGDERRADGRLSIQFRSPHAGQYPDCYMRDRDGHHQPAFWRAELSPE